MLSERVLLRNIPHSRCFTGFLFPAIQLPPRYMSSARIKPRMERRLQIHVTKPNVSIRVCHRCVRKQWTFDKLFPLIKTCIQSRSSFLCTCKFPSGVLPMSDWSFSCLMRYGESWKRYKWPLSRIRAVYSAMSLIYNATTPPPDLEVIRRGVIHVPGTRSSCLLHYALVCREWKIGLRSDTEQTIGMILKYSGIMTLLIEQL